VILEVTESSEIYVNQLSTVSNKLTTQTNLKILQNHIFWLKRPIFGSESLNYQIMHIIVLLDDSAIENSLIVISSLFMVRKDHFNLNYRFSYLIINHYWQII
jgi:hypothetical protein